MPAGAEIRPFERNDKKLVLFVIGKANFGVLGIANHRGIITFRLSFFLQLTHEKL